MAAMPDLRPIFVCGPTAAGKSAIALALAQSLEGEIVNADAYQVYRGLEILSAAPGPEDLARVPHHLFGILDPSESFDAFAYRQRAVPVIAAIAARGRVPIVVGGSGMYLKFLTHGISPVPASDPATRAALDSRSTEDLVAEFQNLDPLGAARTNLSNRRYVIRALEICLLSGKPMSAIKDAWISASAAHTATLRGILVNPPADELRSRIAARTRSILDSGARDEVAALVNPSATCEKAIGIAQIRRWITGEINRPTCESLITHATSQYAKRQRTWFKKETWLRGL
jgi:tRNA dimethylallyltransferase